MPPESRKILLIWLFISVLVGLAISIVTHGSGGIVENFPFYFLPLAIGSLAGVLIAQGRQTMLAKGALSGFAVGLILIGFALVASFARQGL